MSDPVLKAFEEAFGVWTTNGYFKHKPTQHQLDGFRKGHAIAEQASADRIAQLEKALAEAKKDQARYRFVRDMTPEDFGNLSTINEDFDSQVDEAIKEQGK